MFYSHQILTYIQSWENNSKKKVKNMMGELEGLNLCFTNQDGLAHGKVVCHVGEED